MLSRCLIWAIAAAHAASLIFPIFPPKSPPPTSASADPLVPAASAAESFTPPAEAETMPVARAEWFDVAAGRVLRTYPVTDELRRETKRLLLSVDGIYPRARIEPEGGHILHVELVPPLKLSTPWISGDIADVYIMFDATKPDEPVKLLLTSGNSVQWLTASRNAAALLSVLQSLDPFSAPPSAEE